MAGEGGGARRLLDQVDLTAKDTLQAVDGGSSGDSANANLKYLKQNSADLAGAYSKGPNGKGLASTADVPLGDTQAALDAQADVTTRGKCLLASGGGGDAANLEKAVAQIETDSGGYTNTIQSNITAIRNGDVPAALDQTGPPIKGAKQ